MEYVLHYIDSTKSASWCGIAAADIPPKPDGEVTIVPCAACLNQPDRGYRIEVTQ